MSINYLDEFGSLSCKKINNLQTWKIEDYFMRNHYT